MSVVMSDLVNRRVMLLLFNPYCLNMDLIHETLLIVHTLQLL